jgi:hypothetical protein
MDGTDGAALLAVPAIAQLKKDGDVEEEWDDDLVRV